MKCLAVLLLLMCSGALHAQVTSGSISGTVQDESGAAVPSASVTVSDPDTGVVRHLVTSPDGAFVATSLQPGTYTITVSLDGFQKYEKTGVALSAAGRVDAGAMVLAVGSLSDVVTVTADAGRLQLQNRSGERSDVITGGQIQNLALNGRNILDMMKILPGVVSEVNGQVSGRGELGSFNINGTRSNQHQFTIDGTSNVDTGNNGAVHVTVNPDAIAEVKVLTSNYQAEYGKAGGGAVAIVTKGGSRDFHGGARWFHRNESLNANNFFNNQFGIGDDGEPIAPRPKYRYNYAGYEVSGPVLLPGTDFNKDRSKLFFYFAQEYYRQLIPAGNPANSRVPTPAELRGDFSQTFDANGHLIVIRDPLNNNQPFPGNQIPASRILPGMAAAFGVYPQPNVFGRNDFNYTSQFSGEYPRREDIVRIDFQPTSAHRIYARFINNTGTQDLPYGAGPWGISAFGFREPTVFEEPGWNLSVNLTSTLSSTLVNEFTVGPSVGKLRIYSRNNAQSRAANGVDLPLLFPVSAESAIPDFSFGGVPGQSLTWSYLGGLPFTNANTTIDVSNHTTKILGRHTVKGGIFFQRNRKDQDAWGNANGEFFFDGADASQALQTSHPFANALLGYYTTFRQTSVRRRGYYRYTNLEWYLQDTWQASKRLTLDYGMRFTKYAPQYDSRNQLAVFNPDLFDPAAAPRIYRSDGNGNAFDPENPGTTLPGFLVGTLVPDSGNLGNGIGLASEGYPRGGIDDRGVMFEPRFGFAWQATADGRTVIRGGAGIMHDRIQGNLIYNPVNDNPPNVIAPVFRHGSVTDLPALSGTEGVRTPPNILGVSRNGEVPTIYSFSLGVQRDIGWGTTVDVAYVGSLSRHLVQTRNLNAVPYGTTFQRFAQDPTKFEGGVVPEVEPDLPDAYRNAGYSFSGRYAYDTNLLRPYPGYGRIQFYEFNGNSSYHSLQVAVNRRFGKGLSFGANYTYSKTRVTASSDEDWTNPFDVARYDERRAAWDRPHVLAINYFFRIPKAGGPKWLQALTDGFTLSGITQLASGNPVEPELWSPAELITGSPAGPDWNQVPMRPYLSGDPNRPVGTSKFDPAAFAAPNVGVPNPWPRTYLRRGGLANFDMSLFKDIPFGKGGRYLQLRLEAFNVFNHTNFRDVNLNMSLDAPSGAQGPVLRTGEVRPEGATGNYGQYFGEYTNTYTGTGGPRVVQLGVKVSF